MKKYWYEQNLIAAFEDMEEEESCEETVGDVSTRAGVKRVPAFGPPCARKARRTEDENMSDEGEDGSEQESTEAKTNSNRTARSARGSARTSQHEDVEEEAHLSSVQLDFSCL